VDAVADVSAAVRKEKMVGISCLLFAKSVQLTPFAASNDFRSRKNAGGWRRDAEDEIGAHQRNIADGSVVSALF
jgi:hypothetical protein